MFLDVFLGERCAEIEVEFGKSMFTKCRLSAGKSGSGLEALSRQGRLLGKEASAQHVELEDTDCHDLGGLQRRAIKVFN